MKQLWLFAVMMFLLWPLSAGAKEITIDAGVKTVELNAAANVLSTRKIILFIDQSGSMRKTDCPGGLSRWDWCAQQSAELARLLVPFTQNNLTIVPFATEYTVHENCTPATVAKIFKTGSPKGKTNLLNPLIGQLAHHLANKSPNRRPVVIAIISDGRPDQEFEVDDAIITATKRMRHPKEVSIVFLQVGDAFNGKKFLTDIDEHLVERGAKYDAVSVRTFDTLVQLGLARTLANAIQEIDKSGKRP
ncbi:MAG: hypothetical protein K2X29_01085 [Candidatus Obscuribacterales bacterium]|nr:hypothetical protein [Candidatus Obscuribacterales bacterium]